MLTSACNPVCASNLGLWNSALLPFQLRSSATTGHGDTASCPWPGRYLPNQVHALLNIWQPAANTSWCRSNTVCRGFGTTASQCRSSFENELESLLPTDGQRCGVNGTRFCGAFNGIEIRNCPCQPPIENTTLHHPVSLGPFSHPFPWNKQHEASFPRLPKVRQRLIFALAMTTICAIQA